MENERLDGKMGKDLKGKELGKGIAQRKDGLYYARRKCADGTKICIYGKNYQKLKKELEEAAEKHNQKTAIVCNYTVAEWFREWFKVYKAPTVKPSSVNPMLRNVENTFLKKIGFIKLDCLRSIDVQSALNELMEEGKYARKSIAEALSRLEDCFDSAVNNRLIPTNPGHGLKLPYDSDREQYSERRFLAPDEIETFLTVTKDNWFYELYYIMIFMGLRIGEVGGLKWSDVDFKKNSITLNLAMHCEYDNGVKKMYLGTLKSSKAYRTIPMSNGVREALLNQQKKTLELKKRLGNRFKCIGEFDNLVFMTSLGSPVVRYSVENALNRVTNEINIQESFHAAREGREPVVFEKLYPHALRHTYASLCYQAGVDVKTLQNLMGHSHLSTTMDIYTHLSEEYVKQDISKLNDFISSLKNEEKSTQFQSA